MHQPSTHRQVKELKRLARMNLTGHYKPMMSVFIFSYTIPLLLQLPFSYVIDLSAGISQEVISYVVDFLIQIIAAVLMIGSTGVHLKMARRQEHTAKDIFYPFRYNSNYFFLGAILLQVVYFMVWAPANAALLTYLDADLLAMEVEDLAILIGCWALSILLYLIVYLTCALFYYVLLDHEDMPLVGVFKTAAGLMKGNKLRLIRLLLSFLGMWILVLVSFGIGILWIQPYMQQAMAIFYLDAIGEELPYENPPEDAAPSSNPYQNPTGFNA